MSYGAHVCVCVCLCMAWYLTQRTICQVFMDMALTGTWTNWILVAGDICISVLRASRALDAQALDARTVGLCLLLA